MRRRGPGGPVGHPSSHLSRGLRLPTPSLRYLENEMRIISKSHVQTQFLPSFYSCHAGVAESTASFPSLWFSISLLAFLHRLPISYCECGLCTYNAVITEESKPWPARLLISSEYGPGKSQRKRFHQPAAQCDGPHRWDHKGTGRLLCPDLSSLLHLSSRCRLLVHAIDLPRCY